MIKKQIRVATIDLYNNERNEGMRCISDLVSEAAARHEDVSALSYATYTSRYTGDVPGIEDFDILISSGGPGSPFEDDGKQWETDYFRLIDTVWNFNAKNTEQKKFVFFICHSFQLMARHFKFAEVNQRYKKSFGIWSFLKTAEAEDDKLFSSLNNPFFAADFRQFQVVNPDENKLHELGAKVLATELPHGDGHESAVMAVRISAEMAGTQFHPEADADSMIYHFKQQERKDYITEHFGEQKYFEMLAGLEDPDKIRKTRTSIIPSFLDNAIISLTA